MQQPFLSKAEVEMISVEMWGQYQRLWEGSEGIPVINRLQVLTYMTTMLFRKWIPDDDDRKRVLEKFPTELRRLDALATLALKPKTVETLQ